MAEQTILKVGNTALRFGYERNDAALFLALGAAVAEVQALEFHLGSNSLCACELIESGTFGSILIHQQEGNETRSRMNPATSVGLCD
jgi:hypothetical protein